MNLLTWPDLIGYLGVAMLVGAYGWLQTGRLDQGDPWYSGLNALAAVLLLVSLIYKPNPASIVIEVFWLAISLYGLWRSLTGRSSRPSAKHSDPQKPGTPPPPA